MSEVGAASIEPSPGEPISNLPSVGSKFVPRDLARLREENIRQRELHRDRFSQE